MRKIFKALLIAGALVIGLGVLGNIIGQNKPGPAPARSTRDSEAYAMSAVGENAIRSMLKDPNSAVFTETEGRIKGGMHVACGYVNAKNSFGAMAGKSPWRYRGDQGGDSSVARQPIKI